jgi:hypothetical protein
MFLSGMLRSVWIVAVLFCPVAISAAVIPGSLEKNLPRHSAMVIGADFSAFRGDPRAENFFQQFPDAGRVIDNLDQAVLAGDSRGEKCTAIFRWNRSAAAPELRKHLFSRLEEIPPEVSSGQQIYLLKGASYGGGAVFFREFDHDGGAVYAGYPEDRSLMPDCSGIVPALEQIIPTRRDVFIYGAGFPRRPEYPLNTVKSFDFALESDINGDLRFHGQICFRTPLDAIMAKRFMPSALKVLLENQFQVPADETQAAWDALDIRRQGNILLFSSTELPPAARVLGRVLESCAGTYGAMLK